MEFKTAPINVDMDFNIIPDIIFGDLIHAIVSYC